MTNQIGVKIRVLSSIRLKKEALRFRLQVIPRYKFFGFIKFRVDKNSSQHYIANH
jgi:hypothetical protein